MDCIENCEVIDKFHDEALALRKELTTITEENEKLRAALELTKNERDEAIVTAYNRGAALEEIANLPSGNDSDESPKYMQASSYLKAVDIARNALEGGGKG